MIPLYLDNLFEIKEYGICSETVARFAELVTLELYQDGTIDLPGLDPEIEYEEGSPIFREALLRSANLFQDRMLESIERGQLKTTWLTRSLKTGLIDAENTLIHYEDLVEFLNELGFRACRLEHSLGDYFWNEIELATTLTEIVKHKRLIKEKIDPDEVSRRAKEISNDETKIMRLVEENLQYRLNAAQDSAEKESASSEEKPLTKRERNTLLILIAALAKQMDIDLSKPAKSGVIISRYTELLGAPVDHSTIENKLKDIPAVLAARKK